MRVNIKTIVLPIRIITGKEILIAAGYDTDKHGLVVHYTIDCSRIEMLRNNDIIDLTNGVVRFTALPLTPPCS